MTATTDRIVTTCTGCGTLVIAHPDNGNPMCPPCRMPGDYVGNIVAHSRS